MELLLHWQRTTDLDDNLIYKKASENQEIFMRDDVGLNLLKAPVFVISSHMSKSCRLPVYYIKMMNGIKVIMRGNFYDWKLSVDSPVDLPANCIPIDCVSGGIKDDISECYCEGFKDEWVFGKYNPENPGKQFTIECADKYRLYVALHSLKNCIPNYEYKLEDNTLDKDFIVEVIKTIYDKYGYNEMYEDTSWGKPVERRQMSSWEILWKTYCKLGNLTYSWKPEYDPSIEHLDCMHTMDEPEKLADFILKYPTVYNAFRIESQMFIKEYEDYKR